MMTQTVSAKTGKSWASCGLLAAGLLVSSCASNSYDDYLDEQEDAYEERMDDYEDRLEERQERLEDLYGR